MPPASRMRRSAGEAQGADVLIVDTAGRLQNKTVLMGELEKIVRVIKKVDPTAPHAVLLVLDATVGQNALAQVEAFRSTAGVTGLAMTKLDGTARGGILVAIAETSAAGAFHRRRRGSRRPRAVRGARLRPRHRGTGVTRHERRRRPAHQGSAGGADRANAAAACDPEHRHHHGAGVDGPDRGLFHRQARHRRARRCRAGVPRS